MIDVDFDFYNFNADVDQWVYSPLRADGKNRT